MLTCEVGSTPYPRKADVLDLVTSRTQGNHPNQALDAGGLVVLPHLMTLDWVSGAAAATYLAATTGVLVYLRANPVPIPRGHLILNVREPARLRDKLNRQSRFCPCLHDLMMSPGRSGA
jgi:hypothetical protein